MNREIAMKWVADLRDPNLKQGQTFLRTVNDEYCCLGVLCDKTLKIPSILSENRYLFGPAGSSLATAGLTTPEIRKLTSIKTEFGETLNSDNLVIDGIKYNSLAAANDDGVPFSKIADWIEINWEKL